MRLFTALACLACAPLAHAGSALLLAPGHSVTLIDVSDPALRVVVTASAAAPLDLGRLLEANGKSSLVSIVTAVQLGAPGALVDNPDGSIAISAGQTAHGEESALADGAVLVFSEGRYVGMTAPATGLPAPTTGLEISPRDPLNLGAMVPGVASKAVSPAPQMPSSGLVPSGTAAVTGMSSLSGSTSPGIINSQPFSISGSGSITLSGSAALNGVTGQSPSMINGALSSNGTVQIGNPNGAPITGGGAISVTGSSSGTATTLK